MVCAATDELVMTFGLFSVGVYRHGTRGRCWQVSVFREEPESLFWASDIGYKTPNEAIRAGRNWLRSACVAALKVLDPPPFQSELEDMAWLRKSSLNNRRKK